MTLLISHRVVKSNWRQMYRSMVNHVIVGGKSNDSSSSRSVSSLPGSFLLNRLLNKAQVTVPSFVLPSDKVRVLTEPGQFYEHLQVSTLLA